METGKILTKIKKQMTDDFLNEDFVSFELQCTTLIEIAKMHDNKNDLAEYYGYLGYMHLEISNFDEAIQNILMALGYSNEGRWGIANAGHMAMCYKKLKKYDKAFYYVDRAIKASEALNHHGGKHDWYNYKANILLELDEFEEALSCVEKSIEAIPHLHTHFENAVEYYQPYLTKFEIYSIRNHYSNEYYELKDLLNRSFDLYKEPKLHTKRDKKKFLELLKRGTA